MRIVVDLQACQFNGRFRGIGRYALNLFEHMVGQAGRHEIIACLNDVGPEATNALFERLARVMPRENIRVWSSIAGIAATAGTDRARRRERHACLLRDSFIASLRPDVLHTASLFEGFGDDTAVRVKSGEGLAGRTAVTLYDLIPLIRPDEYLRDDVTDRWYRGKLAELKSAGLLLAISESSRHEAIEYLGIEPANVVNISSGVDPMFVPWERSEADELAFRHKFGLPGRYVLYTGGFDSRKNLARLVRAWASLPRRRDAQLVFAGWGEPTAVAELTALGRACGLPDDAMQFLGYVSDGDLIRLYSVTSAFVFPSTHEGFGLPILEAMACGAPVIAADATSLPEVVGFGAALFDPLSTESIAMKLDQVLEDKAFSQVLREHARVQQHRFSWNDSAAAALNALEALADRKRPSMSRIACIEHSGNGAESLVQALRSHRADAADAVVDSLPEGDCHVLVQGEEDGLHASRVVVAGAGMTLGQATSVRNIYQLHGYAIARQAHAAAPQADMPVGWLPGRSVHAAVLTPQFARRVALSRADDRYVHDWLILDTASDAADAAERVIAFATNAHLYGARALTARLVSRFREKTSNGNVGGKPDDDDRLAFAKAVATNHPDGFRKKQILVDVSELVHQDQATGIQRVVRRVLAELLDWRQPDLRVEPVYFAADGQYRYAGAFTSAFLGLPEALRDDAPVDHARGDVFIGLDLAQQCVVQSQDWFKRLRVGGVQVYFVIYDLLPWIRSEFFHPAARANFEAWLRAISAVGDGVVCISRAVADEFIEHLEGLMEPAAPRATPLKIGYFHLGADLDADAARRHTSAEEAAVARRIPADQPLVLMVSTLEPRKGYRQALEAFDLLWSRGEKLSLVIVGKRGWLFDQFADRLRQHPQWKRQLFWFEAASDGLLQELYVRATVLLAASEGEGFGLPLIEAAQLEIPLLCRDLPVFREVAGTHATYFSGRSPATLAQAVSDWMGSFAAGTAVPSHGLERLTWRASARQLVGVILKGDWYADWSTGARLVRASFSTRMGTQVGALQLGRMGTTGEGGVLLHGPYAPLARGNYQLRVLGRLGAEASSCVHVEVVHGNGAQGIADFRPALRPHGSVILDETFSLDEDVRDLEVRIWVGDGDVMTVAGIEISSKPGGCPPTVRYRLGDPIQSMGTSPEGMTGGQMVEGAKCV